MEDGALFLWLVELCMGDISFDLENCIALLVVRGDKSTRVRWSLWKDSGGGVGHDSWSVIDEPMVWETRQQIGYRRLEPLMARTLIIMGRLALKRPPRRSRIDLSGDRLCDKIRRVRIFRQYRSAEYMSRALFTIGTFIKHSTEGRHVLRLLLIREILGQSSILFPSSFWTMPARHDFKALNRAAVDAEGAFIDGRLKNIAFKHKQLRALFRK
jgi:hypothetical protein